MGKKQDILDYIFNYKAVSVLYHCSSVKWRSMGLLSCKTGGQDVTVLMEKIKVQISPFCKISTILLRLLKIVIILY